MLGSTLMKSVAPKRTTSRARTPRRSRYHHGNLREALIEATLKLVEEGGIENVSVREAAKRAGVSPGAPFRHFPDRKALMTAVAEEATRRLRDAILEELAKTSKRTPLQRFNALGSAYMRWVLRNPTHFQVVSNRQVIDFDGSESLRHDNDEIKSIMDGLLAEAASKGELRHARFQTIPLAARALAYGMARMHADGHLPYWGVKPGEEPRAFQAVFKLFTDSLAVNSDDAGESPDI